MRHQRTRSTLKRLFGVALLFFALYLLPAPNAGAQTLVDETVATVSSGAPQPDLITRSDLIWQLALQPGTALAAPNIDDLNRALRLVINQRLILQEAGKLPAIEPTAKDIDAAISDLIKAFPSNAEFQTRAQSVGLTSEQLREIVRQRLQIDNYLDFRFRSFTAPTDAEIEDYYRQVYTVRLRQTAPGRIVPTLDQARDQIRQTLTENKIESDTDAFLDNARERAEIVCLDPAYQCAAP